MKKKAKKQKKKLQNTQGGREDARDELVALEAIFGEDLEVHPDEQGFTLRVVPHPGDVETNYVFVQLQIRYPQRYPQEALQIRIVSSEGLEADVTKTLVKELHQSAASFAKGGEVCCFQIVQTCQELLQEHNVPPDDVKHSGPQSLWEQMQLRSAVAVDGSQPVINQSHTAFDTPHDPFFYDRGDALFGDAFDFAGATVAADINANPRGLTRKGPTPGAAAQNTAAEDATRRAASGTPVRERVTEAEPEHKPRSDTHPQEHGAFSEEHVPNTALVVPRQGETSIGQSFSTVVKSLSLLTLSVLPRALRQYLEPNLGSTSGNSTIYKSGKLEENEGSGDALVDDDEMVQLRKEMLMGHLLSLATGTAGPLNASLPPHALPAVADMLQARGLIPRWVNWTLTQQPELFNRAFLRVFANELSGIGSIDESAAVDPATVWATERFWHRRVQGSSTPFCGSHRILDLSMPGKGPPLRPDGMTPQTSRFASDFSKVKVLGRGAFGVVVLAVNRFDGRSYAVKRILLSHQSPSAYARIMREVATLSRLQHAHVVRYYQAWIENVPQVTGAHDGGTELRDSEGDAWDSTSDFTSVNPVATTRRHVPIDHVSSDRNTDTVSGTEASSVSLLGIDGGNAAVAGHLMNQKRSVLEANSDLERSESSFTFDGTRPGTLNQAVSGPKTNTDAAASSLPSAPVRRKPTVNRVLFIQMEYCRSTLRDLLDAGPLEEITRWKLLRQLLSGLAHIHAQGIIHRDLKPANIFVDDRDDIKLGDFGLAKFSRAGPNGTADMEGGDGNGPPLASVTSKNNGGVELFPSDKTGMVGTHFYMSPELRQGSGVLDDKSLTYAYDERVDIYSLGIIVFELWHPFQTAMERVSLLRDLREHGTLPPAFSVAHPAPAALIQWLLSPNPLDRPTAVEALRSELLPPTVGDEQLTDLLRSLPDNPSAFDRIVGALFAPPRTGQAALQVVAPDSVPLAGWPAEGAQHPEAREQVLGVLRTCFARHGAVAMRSRDIGASGLDDPQSTMHVLSKAGARLALRYELRQPFAGWVAAQIASGGGLTLVEGFRRYEIAEVHRSVSSASHHGFRSHIQADFDVLTAPSGTGHAVNPREPPVGEAEVLCTVADVLNELPECSGRWEVRLGHRALFDAALLHSGVPKESRLAVLAVLRGVSMASPLHPHTPRQQRWPVARQALEGLGLSQDAIARIKQFMLQFAGESQAALHRLGILFSNTSTVSPHRKQHPSVGSVSHQGWLSDLRALLPLLAGWAVPASRIVVDPLMAPHADHHTAIFFEVHLVDDVSGGSAVVAIGGRYDALLRASWARQSASVGYVGASMGPPVGAVGVTLAVERIIAAVSGAIRPQLGSAGLSRLSASDVLVCSRGSGSGGVVDATGRLTERTNMRLMARVRILRMLWDAGVAAEMLPSAAPSLTDQFAYATSHGIPWLVIVNADEVTSTETVRLKHLHSKLEEDVPVADLARHLGGLLQPHVGSSYWNGVGGRQTTAAGAVKAYDEAENEAIEKERRRRDKR